LYRQRAICSANDYFPDEHHQQKTSVSGKTFKKQSKLEVLIQEDMKSNGLDPSKSEDVEHYWNSRL
jgi:hypothetical protein